jgi:hypothetical protein
MDYGYIYYAPTKPNIIRFPNQLDFRILIVFPNQELSKGGGQGNSPVGSSDLDGQVTRGL